MISSRGRRATSSLALAAALAAGCGGGAKPAGPAAPPGEPAVARGAPVAFEFDSLDDRPVTAQAMRGKPCVLTFVTTGSLPAQAQVDYLVPMARNDGDRVNYAVVSLDPATNRELVEIYRKSLHVTFPVAMADDATRSGAGAFGDVTQVPVTVVLDRLGRVALRVDGRVAKSDELRAAIRVQ